MKYRRLLSPTPLLMSILVLGFAPSGAHCPDNPAPTAELFKPSQDVSIVKICYRAFETCLIDTFYQDTLLQELKTQHDIYSHAVFGYVDSVKSRIRYDTMGLPGRIFVDTQYVEDIWISIHSDIKGVMPERHLFFTESSPADIHMLDPHTYSTLVGTPFMAFFETWDHIGKLGIKPTAGCFREPTAYLVSRNLIEKKGPDRIGMPGIQVPVADFFKAIGHPGMDVPQVRPGVVAVRPKKEGRLGLGLPGAKGMDVYDVQGKRLRKRSGPGIYLVKPTTAIK